MGRDEAKTVEWKKNPEEHDYPAALSYLTLLYTPAGAQASVKLLQDAETTEFAAKDIFRAAQLPELDVTNYHVKKNAAKINQGEKMSPILLVRDTIRGKLVIADGYHRICAVYQHDEDAMVPCRIV